MVVFAVDAASANAVGERVPSWPDEGRPARRARGRAIARPAPRSRRRCLVLSAEDEAARSRDQRDHASLLKRGHACDMRTRIAEPAVDDAFDCIHLVLDRACNELQCIGALLAVLPTREAPRQELSEWTGSGPIGGVHAGARVLANAGRPDMYSGVRAAVASTRYSESSGPARREGSTWSSISRSVAAS